MRFFVAQGYGGVVTVVIVSETGELLESGNIISGGNQALYYKCEYHWCK